MRVAVVEDEAMLRDSLVKVINAEPDLTVGLALADAAELVSKLEHTEVDIVLMDVCTEHNSSGIVACQRVKDRFPDMPVVIMTGLPEMTFVRQARDAGADSFVYKNVSTAELVGVLRSTAEGYSTFPANRSPAAGEPFDLTIEEVEVLRLVCEGRQRKEIARELLVSEGTLKRRISELLLKTGFDSLLKLAVYMVSNGYIVPNIESQ